MLRWRRLLRGLDPRRRTTVGKFWFAMLVFALGLFAMRLATIMAMLYSGGWQGRSEIALLLSLIILVVASIVTLSCLYVRRMRDAGLPTWLVLLPNVPTMSVVTYGLHPDLSMSEQDMALACFLVATPVSWIAAGVLALKSSNGRDFPELTGPDHGRSRKSRAFANGSAANAEATKSQ